MKNWFKKVWTRFKAWVIALLISIGLIVPALAGVKDFAYTRAVAYTDGTPLPIDQIAETRLYCDGDPTPKVVKPGADGTFTGVVFAPGEHSCTATHVATNGLESVQSDPVVFTILPEVAPNPPTALTVN